MEKVLKPEKGTNRVRRGDVPRTHSVIPVCPADLHCPAEVAIWLFLLWGHLGGALILRKLGRIQTPGCPHKGNQLIW